MGISWTLPRGIAGVVALALCLPSAACLSGSDDPPVLDLSAALFDPDHVVQVSVSLNPSDWDALRLQGRTIEDILGAACLDAPFPSPYSWFRATVIIDGRRLDDVAVRKKGFLGSLDEAKPSLKLKFDEFVPGRELFGLDRITLNNCKQDPSYVRQAQAYSAFRRAGIAAPRCNFAHVVVNGTDMGVYAHVESVDKQFLRRNFAGDEGNLYEGTLSDFRTQWMNTFAKKTNEEDASRGDLQAVTTALEAPDPDVLNALAGVLDVDRFITFWAAEVLVNHWDGYANNTNNFLVYADPPGGPFRFIPWGADGVMTNGVPFGSPGQPVSVFAKGALARRLYLLPETQSVYIDRLNALLNTAWNESEILADIDRMEALISPIADPGGTGSLAAAIGDVRTFVANRRADILSELSGGPPPWTEPLADPPCLEFRGDISGTFSTTYGTLGAPNPFATGIGTHVATIDGTPRTVMQVGAMAGSNPDPDSPGAMTQGVALLDDGTVDIVVILVDFSRFAPGQAIPLDWGSAVGILINFDPPSGTATLVGFIFNGYVQFTQAGTAPNDPVSGSFQGQVVRFGP